MFHRIPHKTRAVFVDSGTGVIAEQASIFKQRNPEVLVTVSCDGDFKSSVQFCKDNPDIQVRLFINEQTLHCKDIMIHWRATSEAR